MHLQIKHDFQHSYVEPFIPASHNLFLHWTADLLSPTFLKLVQNIDEIIISREDKRMLRTLQRDRLLFFTNHPTTAEPPITYQIGNLMGVRFKFMAARRVFDFYGGLVGKALSQTGGFSVLAGIDDRASMRASREALSAPQGKLVLYPEGEPTSGENDRLIPFQPGLIRISFWAMDDIRKVEPEGDITILPGFIKYKIQGSTAHIRDHLASSIRKVERRLSINPGNKNLLRRFLTIGRVLLEQLEYELKIKPEANENLDARLARAHNMFLDRVADRLGVKNFDKNVDVIQKIRRLFAVHEMLSIGYQHSTLPRVSQEELDWAYREIVKAYDFIIIRREYLMSYPSPERFYEWLARYESYVFGATARALGGEPSPLPRKAYVSFAKPFGLSEYWSADRKAKKEGMTAMAKRMRADMQKLLDESIKLSEPIVKPYDVGEDFIT